MRIYQQNTIQSWRGGRLPPMVYRWGIGRGTMITTSGRAPQADSLHSISWQLARWRSERGRLSIWGFWSSTLKHLVFCAMKSQISKVCSRFATLCQPSGRDHHHHHCGKPLHHCKLWSHSCHREYCGLWKTRTWQPPMKWAWHLHTCRYF